MSSRIVITSSVRAALMHILDGIALYRYHSSNDVPSGKLDGLIEKFKAKYPDLERDKHHAFRQRAKGLPTHRLIVYRPKDEKNEGFFCLQCTHKNDSEPWKDGYERNERIELYGYECVRITKKNKDHAVWTWRITEEIYKTHAGRLIDAIGKGQDDYIENWIKKSTYWPGFAGVRQQHKALGRLFYGRWVRIRRTKPARWPHLYYVTRRILTKDK